MESQILISEEEYDELLENSRFLEALQAAGVDNWDGYDYARDIFNELNKESNYE